MSTRPHHSHITQSPRSPVTGCPACALIRPEAMTLHPYAIEGLSAAGQLPPVPQPQEVAQ